MMQLKKVQLRDGVVASGTARKRTEHQLMVGKNATALWFADGFVHWQTRGGVQLIPVHNVKGMEPAAEPAQQDKGPKRSTARASARR